MINSIRKIFQFLIVVSIVLTTQSCGNAKADSSNDLVVEEQADSAITADSKQATFKIDVPTDGSRVLVDSVMALINREMYNACEDCVHLDEGVTSFSPEEMFTDDGKQFIRVKGVRWFTNLEHNRHNETMILVRRYYEDPSKFPHYDNYDAIEVSKTVEIPCDYDGIMGVPITFLDKYSPKQFEILGMSGTNFAEGVPSCHIEGTSRNAKINGKNIYRRLFIRKIADFI